MFVRHELCCGKEQQKGWGGAFKYVLNTFPNVGFRNLSGS